MRGSEIEREESGSERVCGRIISLLSDEDQHERAAVSRDGLQWRLGSRCSRVKTRAHCAPQTHAKIACSRPTRSMSLAVLVFLVAIVASTVGGQSTTQPSTLAINTETTAPTTSVPTSSGGSESPASTPTAPPTPPQDVPQPDTSTVTVVTSTSTSSALATSPAATPDRTEPPTSTTESAGPADEKPPSTEVASDESDEPPAGIEPKSISRDRPADNEPTNDEDKSAELSVDSGPAGSGAQDSGYAGVAPETETGASADSTVRPEGAASGQASQASIVNMTQIDQMYVEGRKDESEIAESWRRMGKKLQRTIGGLIGSMVPMALNMSQEAKISSNCSGAMLKWVLSMNQLKLWALGMLDASGKPVAGMLAGSLTMFGNYRQCVKLRAPDDDEIEFAGSFREYFRGKYCIIQAKPWLPKKSRFYNLNAKLAALQAASEQDAADEAGGAPGQWYERTLFDELADWALSFNYVDMRFDLCVPSLCKREDIQKVINYLMRGLELKARVLRCEMESDSPYASAIVEGGSLGAMSGQTMQNNAAGSNSSQPPANFLEQLLHSRKVSQLGWLLIPLLATLLVLVATALSLTLDSGDKRATGATSKHRATDNDNYGYHTELEYRRGHLVKGPTRSKLAHTIQSLSLKRSVSSHLNVDYGQLADDKPLALYGVRIILVLWVILVESCINMKFEYLRELMVLKDLIFWWPVQIIINSTLQYDSFILLTAFTMGYKNCLNDGVNQAKAITRFVLDKYIRLMPSIMLLVALVVVTPMFHKGPVWNDYVATQSALCQSTGWLNAIFLQNFLPYDQIVSIEQMQIQTLPIAAR